MMPGENQSKVGGIASDATSGTCQNCTVLNQSLDEYVAALLTLKQKIIDTDLLLSEFKEKCDELQKSQRESSKLHRQLDEVLLKLEPLEKQTAEYEHIKTELEKTKGDLRCYQQKCEEVEKLRADNDETLILKGKVEESLRNAEDMVQRQILENEKLKVQQKTLEENLQKTQDSLQKYQQATEDLENLKLDNAKTLILKGNLENELLVLKETTFQQNSEITDIKNEKRRLEDILDKTQQRLNTLEQEFNKEKRTTSSQTETELHIDKDKVRMLLEELWHCVEPSSQTHEQLLRTGDPTPLKKQFPPQPQPVFASPLRKQVSCQSPEKLFSPKTHLLYSKRSTPTLKESPKISRTKSSELNSPQNIIKHNKEQQCSMPSRKRKINSDELEQVNSWTNEIYESSQKEINNEDLLRGDLYTDLEDIKELFTPLPSVLSPLHSPLMMDGSNDDMPELENVLENHLEAQSDIQMIKNTTSLHSDVKSQKSLLDREVEKSYDHFSPFTHLNPKPVADLDVVNTSSESQHMEVEDVSEINKTLNPTAQLGVENLHTLESSLEDDAKQTVEESFLLNENGDTTQLEETLISQQHVEPDPTSIALVETAECKHFQRQSNVSLMSNLNRVKTNDVNCSKLEENEELKSHAPLEIRTVAHISHDIQNNQNRQTNKLTNEDTSSMLIESGKGSDERKNEGISPFKISKDEESSSEDEGFFGLKRKVRGVRSRSEAKISSEEQDDVSESVQRSSAKQLFEDEHQGLHSESTETCQSGLSTETISHDDEQEAKPPDNKTTISKSQSSSSEDIHGADDSENLQNTSLQTNDKSHQNVEMSVDDLSSGIESLESNVYNHKVTSRDSAEDCPEDISTMCHITPDPETSNSSEKDGTISLVPDLDTKTSLTPPLYFSLGRVRTEMGPPLPPVVMPLTATPPRIARHHTPSKPTRLASDAPKSPEKPTSVPAIDSALSDASKMSPCLTTPSPSCGVPSSPLQFGSATPKHAVPVPGRLPTSALSSSPPAASQENSMQMLDTMYPELSARARTLNILRGNVNLNRSGNENGASPTSVNQISGNKTISSSSTAFTKTEQKPKRTGVNMLLPKSAKRLRLDNCSPAPGVVSPAEQVTVHQPALYSAEPPQEIQNNLKINEKPDAKKNGKQLQISQALAKIGISCFEVLPVVKSHVFLGRISQEPILIDEEKAVIADFCKDQSSMEDLMSAILTKLKTERSSLRLSNLQALCRVYAGLCRQIGDYQKAHSFAYSILREDFPDACKLILFMVTTWPSVLFHETTLCRAIHIVTKLKAEGDILEYLTKYLHWDKSPPCDIYDMISSTLKTLREDKDLTFQMHHRHGHDLCPATWECIFTLDLLCTHLKWKWTHDVVIGKELWPIMNTWITQPRPLQTPIRDVSVAAVLRLIGRLGQLGIKENLFKSVQNVARAINLFGKHGILEGVPNHVQLSAVYAIYDLAPCNPKDALEALASWRSETSQPVPSAVTSCITQIASLCRQMKS
ncbi:little elongation complex subunit 1 isoform X2 [Triplophysa dalaica]|uniref:little elongation complex subunit 1 isoform X2 n=1 Tax=Triplophysa dalaica TaxID=1582913 RepID=UPI0024E0374B|nr:little elongation complex subunit 1 isoform X2 [Triplophysa dalaica]